VALYAKLGPEPVKGFLCHFILNHGQPEETMKRFAPAIIIGLLSTQGFAAAKFQVGSFDLYSEPGHVSSDCNLGTGLILDRGRLLGDVAVFEDFVKGTCKVAVRPNTRFSKLTFVRSNCGSRIYEGGFVTAEGYVQVNITDHRTRLCKDLVPAKIIVTFQSNEGKVQTLYSQDAATVAANAE
jgi:hypothetical protein